MKKFSRVTNSVVMTAALLAVIIGSLCFSVGEGLRLTPFPNLVLSLSQDAGDLETAGTIDEIAIAKYGPVDVPAQTQKRGKRHSVDLFCDVAPGARTLVTANIHFFSHSADLPDRLSFTAPHSGRAPPFPS